MTTHMRAHTHTRAQSIQGLTPASTFPLTSTSQRRDVRGNRPTSRQLVICPLTRHQPSLWASCLPDLSSPCGRSSRGVRMGFPMKGNPLKKTIQGKICSWQDITYDLRCLDWVTQGKQVPSKFVSEASSCCEESKNR